MELLFIFASIVILLLSLHGKVNEIIKHLRGEPPTPKKKRKHMEDIL